MATNRINRINEEVRRELSDIVRELKDPRIPMMTSIVSVSVTADLRYATVYVSIFGDDKTVTDALAALKKSAGFVRRELGHRLNLRYTPEIIYKNDDSIAHGARINELLHREAKPDAE
ncbi:MAG: 30S ribosome-binding factor RbfA [Clostridia bacterium]|nr:30S ribosome-binding factor RbfA [Clostridia bacterium]